MSQQRYTPPSCDLAQLPPELSPITETIRGITPETYALYGVKQDDQGNHVYPYRTKGYTVGYKIRLAARKEFEHHWPDSRAVTMFTPLTQSSGNRYLVICEGEVDAMTVHQATGYTTWSIPLGAPSAAMYLARVGDLLEGYENVYLVMDNDVYGQKAVEECTSLFPELKVATLPPQYKDPNDVARAHKNDPDEARKLIKAAIWGAQSRNPGFMVSRHELAELTTRHLYDKALRMGVSTGWHQLDALIGGHRGGELNVIIGGTGVGKSYVLRQLAWQAQHSLPEGNHVYYLSLEDPLWLATTRWLELDMGLGLLGEEMPTIDRHVLATNIEELEVEIGAPAQEDVLRAIRYQARMGAKLIVLDHLTVYSEQLELGEFTKFMYTLADLLVELDVCLLTASHLRRDTKDKTDNDPSLSRVKNASAIAQVAWCVLGLSRDRSSNRMKLCTLKNSRTWGVSGEAHLQLNQKTRRLEECDPPLDNEGGGGYDERDTPKEDW
jgi:KaiC/GvpD/RAD55 family RecA-like ATPase